MNDYLRFPNKTFVSMLNKLFTRWQCNTEELHPLTTWLPEEEAARIESHTSFSHDAEKYKANNERD